jgi:chromosome condensin MukBEF ATPase and DNA-binding subunit MukB
MENSNEFLVLREQEEIGKRLLQNLKLNKKVWLILMEKIESLSEQSKEVLLELQKLVGVVENGLEKNLVDSTN